MRDYNERLVLSILRRHGALAKASIAQMTGLSAQTVSVIMRQLEQDGLLQRGEPNRVRGKVGQPSIPMSLAADGAYFYGLKLGRRSCDLVLINFVGDVIAKIHRTYPFPTPEELSNFTWDGVAQISAGLNAEQNSRIAGLGIGMPFQLWNWGESIGAPAAVMDTWRTWDIRSEFESRFEFPIYLQNDATAACGAELVFGHNAGPRNFVYFYLGYFVGGGIVLNGSLYTGPNGNAGALGSMPVPNRHGGVDQLIDVASISVLEQMLRAQRQASTSLWESPDRWQIDAKILDQWIDDSAHGIAHAVVAAAAVVDCETVIVDGWLPAAVRSQLVEAVILQLQNMNFTGLERPQVSSGKVGCDARALGAASLPLSLRFMTGQNALT